MTNVAVALATWEGTNKENMWSKSHSSGYKKVKNKQLKLQYSSLQYFLPRTEYFLLHIKAIAH